MTSSADVKSLTEEQAHTGCRAKSALISRIKGEPRIAATHFLQSQECLVKRLQRLSGTAITHKLQSQGGLGQQVSKGVRDKSNSLSAQPRVGLVSRLKRVPGTAATHILQSQGQALSAGLKGCQG